MGPIPFTKQRGTSGRYYFRRRAPKDVIAMLRETVWSDTPNRTHWEKSLGTSNPREAFSEAHAFVEKTDRQIADAHEAIRGRIDGAETAQRHAQALTQAKARVASLDPTDRAEVEAAGGLEALTKDAPKNAGWANIMQNAVEMKESNPISDMLTPAEALAERVEMASDRGAAVETRQVVQKQARILAELGLELDAKLERFAEQEPGLGDVLHHYLDARQQAEETARQYRYAVRRFIELHGDVPVREIIRDHFRNYADAIRDLPSGRKDGIQDLPFKAAVDRANALGLPRITEATQAKHRTGIMAVMGHAAAVGLIETNPIDGFRLPKRRQRQARPPDITQIESALSEAYSAADDNFWPPHVSKWQGMRLEEICQLRRDEIDARTIRVTDAAEGPKVKIHRNPPHRRGLSMFLNLAPS